MRHVLLNSLARYQKSSLCFASEQDMVDRFVAFVKKNEHCFERSNKGHVTGSAWIINHEGTHALLTHHKKFNGWFQLGGHADGDPDIKAVALKEAEEESGMHGFKFIIEDIFDIDIHPIPSACEYHYDVRYILRAAKDARIVVSEESHDVAWIPFEKLAEIAPFDSIERMYQKSKTLLS